MKKMLLWCAAALIAVVVVVGGCNKKEKTDTERGTEDAKALVECIKTATTDAAEAACSSKIDLTKMPTLAKVFKGDIDINDLTADTLAAMSEYEKAFYQELVAAYTRGDLK